MDALRGHISVSGACVGPIVGLVAVTPACGYIQPGWALLFGIIPTIIVYFILLYKHHMKFDDTLDVAIVHGCGKNNLRKLEFIFIIFIYFRWNNWCIYDRIIFGIIS